MSVHQVPRARWAGALEQFSRAHRGWRASVTTVRPGPELAFRTDWHPLDSVAIARRPTAILVNFQGAPAICVKAPRALAIDTREDGIERALEIDGARGEFVLLSFRVIARPEELDGMAPAELGDDAERTRRHDIRRHAALET